MSPVRQSARTSLAGVLGVGGLCVLLIAVAGSSPRAVAQAGGDLCLSASPPARDIPPHRLRFGITPLAAGSAGLAQGAPKPENRAAAMAELGRLRPGRRQVVLRLNRMLMS